MSDFCGLCRRPPSDSAPGTRRGLHLRPPPKSSVHLQTWLLVKIKDKSSTLNRWRYRVSAPYRVINVVSDATLLLKFDIVNSASLTERLTSTHLRTIDAGSSCHVTLRARLMSDRI